MYGIIPLEFLVHVWDHSIAVSGSCIGIGTSVYCNLSFNRLIASSLVSVKKISFSQLPS